MLKQTLDDSVSFDGKNLIYSQIATFIIFFFPPLGGAFYIAGSVVYWPTLSYLNPYTGGLLFTVGSVLLVMADFASSYIQPDFSMFKPLKNIGAFRTLCSFIGNLAFTIGSVYFLPGLPVIVGQDLFFIGSIFQFIPQILCVWGVCSLNIFTAPFYAKMIRYKKTLIWMNVYLVIGCICFFVGTFLFENQNQQSKALQEEAVLLFIIGSCFYLLAPLLALKMRKIRILDPLTKYHDEMHHHYLPRPNNLLSHLQIYREAFAKDQFVILPIEPSFMAIQA